MNHKEIMLSILAREPFETEMITEPLLSDFLRLIESQRYSLYKVKDRMKGVPNERSDLFMLNVIGEL